MFKCFEVLLDTKFQSAIFKGEELHQVLENGVFRYHDIGGRFPQVSEIFFTYDPTRPAGDRVDKRLVKIHNEYLELNKVNLL